MATGLEKRNAESIAVARSNEREEEQVAPSRDLSDRLYDLDQSRKREQILMKEKGEDYSWARKFASNVAIPLGAAAGTAEIIDYAFGSPGDSAWFAESNREMLDQNVTRKRFLSDWAAQYGAEAAEKLDKEDRDFLDNVTVDQPKVLREQNFPTTRSREGNIISDLLGHTVNEGFENSPLYKADPKFWDNLRGTTHREDIEGTYNKQYEFRRKLDFPTYGAFIEAHKVFTDEIEALVKKDASLMQGWEEDFLAMGAGTIEFLSQIAGLDDDQVGMTPFQQRYEAGKMLTGGLVGTAVAALQPDSENKVMGIPLPNLARKPAILTAVVGPGLVRALSAGKGTALGRAIAQRRAVDPSFDAFMSKAEGVKAQIAGSAVGQAVQAVGDIPVPFSKIRDSSPVLKTAGKKAAQYSEDVSGALRQRRVADLVRSGAKGSLYWAWSGAPELGLYHPLVGTFNGFLLNSARYSGLVNNIRKYGSRSADKAQTDLELAEQVGQAEAQVAQMSGDARSTAAAFVLGLDQINEYGAQNVGGLSVMDSPQYLERIQRGEGVLGSDSIAGLPAAEIVLPPNANLPTRSATPTPDSTKTPPPKGAEVFVGAAEMFPSLDSPRKIAQKVTRLTDESKALLQQEINNGLHQTDPVAFLRFLEDLPTRKRNEQYVRQVEADPQVQSLVESAQEVVERVYDESRYTMELPDGDVVRIITEEAQVLDNQALTRDFVVEEAAQLKNEIQTRINNLRQIDEAFDAGIREGLREESARLDGVPDSGVIEGADTPTSRYVPEPAPPGVEPSVQKPRIYGVDVRERPGVASVEAGPRPEPAAAPSQRLQVSDPVPGSGRIPDAVRQVGGEWANRSRVKEIADLERSLELIDVAVEEFLAGPLDNVIERPGDVNGVINTVKEIFATKLEEQYLNLVTNTWEKGGRGQAALEALYKNFGRPVIDGAIARQVKMQRARRTGDVRTPVGQAIDPLFPLTWDGAIVDGTPLARLVREGAVPRRFRDYPRGRGEYMARPYKPSDRPLTDPKRKQDLTDYVEEAGKEPSDPLDPTGFRSEEPRNRAEREMLEARELTERMRAESKGNFQAETGLNLTPEDVTTVVDYLRKLEETPKTIPEPKPTTSAVRQLEAAKRSYDAAVKRREEIRRSPPKDRDAAAKAWEKADALVRERKAQVEKAKKELDAIERSNAISARGTDEGKFREGVEKGWIPPLEEYISLSREGTAKLLEVIRARREGRVKTEARKLTPEELKKASAAREKISKIMRDNDDLLNKKNDSKFEGPELEARLNKRKQVLDQISEIWQGIESRPAKTKPKAAAPAKSARQISRQEKINRNDLRANPDTIYLFGDNLQGKGKAGQAAAMRGEPNAIGIPTKKAPSKDSGAYFTDAEFQQNKAAIDAAFDKIPADKNVVIPEAGLGTGLAQLQKRAPKTFEYIQSKLAELEGKPAPSRAPAKAPKKKSPWYAIEFDKAVKTDIAKRSGVMTKLARRILNDDKIPQSVKETYWRAMISGDRPHISKNYGKPAKKGELPRTDDPAKYNSWHEQIEGYIRGDKAPAESKARTPGITWQASKGSKRLGDQLTEDIARLENSNLSPDQKLAGLNEIKQNILDDVAEGFRKERGSYDYMEADYMSALGEQRLQGKQAVVSRVGTAAINRSKQTGRTVSQELASFMDQIDTAISRAQDAMIKNPTGRTASAIAQARNVWNNKDVTGITPEFIKIIQEFKKKADKYQKQKRPLKYTDIADVEFTGFKENLPIHEQIALGHVAKRIVAADEAHRVNQGIARVANEVDVNRKAERNRIETAVSAIREAMVRVPPKPVRQPKPAAKPQAKPKPEPEAKKGREYKRVDEAVVPTWVKNELNQRLIEFKELGLSKTQAEAISAGFSDVWTQGLTMLASDKARTLVYKKILEMIEADGVTLSPKFKANLELQLAEYLSYFKSPFKGREQMTTYSLDLPGPESASGILEVALRTLPDDFMFTGDVWSGPINVKDAFFDALNDLRKQNKKKDIETIQKEAFVELGNQFASQVQVLAQNKIINGEMARLGITRNSTPLEAASRIVVHRLLYQEAMPLGLFNRLTKEIVRTLDDGAEIREFSLEPVSMKDLADLIRTNRQYMVDAVKAEITRARVENKGWKALTEKQIRRMLLEQDGPLQNIADMLDKYEYRSKISGATQLNNFFNEVIDPEGELLKDRTASERNKKGEFKIIDDELNEVLDYTYNEKVSDQVFNASFNPEYLDSMMFNARLAQNQNTFWNQFTSGMKGNITYESLMTNLGNGLGHSLVAGMLTGELPTTFYGRVARETWLYNKYRKSSESRREFNNKYKEKYPERVEAYDDLYRYGNLDNVDWGSVEAAEAGPLLAKGMKAENKAIAGASKQVNAYRNLRRRIYQLEDNGPRIAEAVREHINFSRELKIMDKGSFLAIPTGKKGITIITKGDAPKSRQGTEFYRGTRNLTKAELSKLKASYVMRKVSGRVFNYKEVPRFIRMLRSGELGAVGALFTPFISFPYLSVDIPGVKKGIFASVLGDTLGSSSGYTNSAKLTAFRATQQAKQKMRVLMWGLNMNQFAHPLNNDLDEISRFNMEPGGSTAAMIRSSQQPNTIGVWRWNNANIFETSMLLMRNIMAMQAQFVNWHKGDKARSNKNLEYYMRLQAEGKVLTKNDVVRVGGISGNLFMRSILQALPKQGNQDKSWWDLEAAMGHIAASLIGVDDWNAIKTALPLTGQAEIKDSIWSSYAPMIRDLESTDQLNFEDMTAQEQMDFMVSNWFKAFSRLYLRQRKIASNDLEVNNQARIALQSFRKELLIPIDKQIQVARGREKERLTEIKNMAILAHSNLAEAYSKFYTAVSELESLKRGRTKEEQKANTNLQRSAREVNNLRKSLEEARSKAVNALKKSRAQTKQARELR